MADPRFVLVFGENVFSEGQTVLTSEVSTLGEGAERERCVRRLVREEEAAEAWPGARQPDGKGRFGTRIEGEAQRGGCPEVVEAPDVGIAVQGVEERSVYEGRMD
ncbi:MAG: hypothetical protein V2A58_02925 [Planctomycetota bacterium]